jgi:hypothetical protein
MRFLNKYTPYQNITSFFKYVPTRILRFKRPKWKKIQLVLKQKSNLKTAFVNNIVLKASFKNWEKNKSYYKDGLMLKKSFYSFYNNSITTTYYKKLIKKNTDLRFTSFFFKIFLKPLFFIDILLWKINFCNSSYEGRQLLNYKQIYVNSKVIQSNYLLKKGDIITVNPKFLTGKLKFENSVLFELFSLFFEIDYYTKTVIIIKDFSALSSSDFVSLISDSIQLKLFVDYIKTK